MKRVLLCLACLMFSDLAYAEVFDPQVTDVCTPVPTPGHPGRLSPRSVIGLLLKNQGIADVDIDTTGADVSYAEKADAVISGPEFCSRAGAHCGKNAKTQLDVAQEILVAYLQRHTVPVSPGTSGYQFTFAVTTANVRDFLLSPNSKLVPTCVAANTEAGTPAPKAPVNTSRIPGRLIVRKNIGDLPIAQNDPAFKGLQQASLSVSNNEILPSTTYNVQGVIGYGFGQSPIGSGAVGEIIPFVAYTGQFVDGANPNKVTNVNNIGPGVTGDLLFPALGVFPLTRGMYNDVQGTVQEVHSYVSATDILSAKLTYTPYFDPTVLPGVGTTALVGDYLLMLMPQGVFISGDVLDNGSNPNLNKSGTYQRLGTHVAFSASAVTGILNGFSFNASYDYLRSYGGPISNIDLFTSTISYTMPQQDFWSVQLQFQDGRNLDTLVKQKLLTLGIGAKY
jgi:hypothetical protein